ncbi:hypothetical protein MNBD_GAMMA19-1992 [hydrothermal vent metagenome]|uniref:Uncharacterized protein n=1 Tax=hydrothermal vent metagenome TaxID=652676 RepID=A0A3B1AHT1_9ZZZZ
MFGFNRQTALLDGESVCWMLDVFDWALVNFDSRKLQAETKLIYPNNDYFPGKESSVEGMAALIFAQVKSYAGIAALPCDLQNETGVSHTVPSESGSAELPMVPDSKKWIFTYHTHTLNNPEVLIASFVHQIAYHIVSSAHNPPPGGNENWPHVAEILATIMGFGVIMANTANTQKIRSCGSCSGPAVERESFLSQYDMSYALAIFCTLKNIPVKEATLHLKKTLRTFYKKAHKEISSKNFSSNDRLTSLQAAWLSNHPHVSKDNQ